MASAILTLTNSGTGQALYANNTATSGVNYGIWGESASTSGRGVLGFATATSGDARGVAGQSASTSGIGVLGLATATSGVNYGVFGQSTSTDGRGVLGYATATSGDARGVVGQSASTSGKGVIGFATATSGNARGVQGQSASTSGKGVLGDATATSGDARGVQGQSASTSGIGVLGLATATSGVNYGVYGTSYSTSVEAAGVVAQGNGVTGAAALEIKNGSIRVTGANKPAGKVGFGPPWSAMTTSYNAPPLDPHNHVMGWGTSVTIDNPLIKPDSVILITPKFDTSVRGGSVAIISQTAGSATVMVTMLGGPYDGFPPFPPPPNTGSLSYLILN